ncbi:MAG: radical SAM protein [Methanospirillaceae archaeon]|nr:radical SAM protein [Methanospirillaceae archaeon]
MKILFIYPPLGEGRVKSPATRRYFPWGVATVMKYLENDGHIIELLDIYGDDLVREEVESFIKRIDHDCVCISGFASYNYAYIIWIAELIKTNKNIPIIIGGIVADLHYNLLLSKPTIDICILGEGELTSVDLFRNWENFKNVNGIAYKNPDIIVNPSRELIKDLDSLPLPNFSLWNMDIYLRGNLWADDSTTRYSEYNKMLPEYSRLHPNFSLFFGRGCPYKCSFCSRSYQTVRFKSVNHVIEEIKFFQKEYGVKAIHFYDELVVFNRNKTIDFCEKIKDLNVYWDCQARVNTVDEELMHIMKASNCYSIGFGFESGSNSLLMAMNKGVTREQNLYILKIAGKIGFHLKIQLMAGYPGETKNTLQDTIDMMKQSSFPPRHMSWATPLPGSELYTKTQEIGLIPDEEEYLLKLAKYNMNEIGRIILNVSGLSDKDMERLFIWAHMSMEKNFLLNRFFTSNIFSSDIFWISLKRFLYQALKWYIFRNNKAVQFMKVKNLIFQHQND